MGRPVVAPLSVPVPRDWSRRAKLALFAAVGLLHHALVHSRGWGESSPRASVRVNTEAARLRAEVALLREDLRIKDARMARIPPRNRPHYPPHERLAILTLQAARAWSAAETARRFLVTVATVASWHARADEEGEAALVRLPAPVNRYPDFVGVVARAVALAAPGAGSRRVAGLLARAGLVLSRSSVRRMLRRRFMPKPVPRRPPPSAREEVSATEADAATPATPARRVVARHPDHVWGVDLTTTFPGGGTWARWIGRIVPQCWPFCWWVAVVFDYHSRSVVALRAFATAPTTGQVCGVLRSAMRAARAKPRHVVTDHGPQFREAFRAWCERRRIQPRHGAVGQHGAIALVERFIKSLKVEHLHRLALLPLRQAAMQRELDAYRAWYNHHRPHQALHGRTPDDVVQGAPTLADRERWEPRPRWPHLPPRLRAPPGAVLEGQVVPFRGRRHLPEVTLREAA